MSPGRSVASPRSITGGLVLESSDAGPTCAIRSPWTRTAIPVRAVSPRPSMRRAALTRTTFCDGGRGFGAWASRQTRIARRFTNVPFHAGRHGANGCAAATPNAERRSRAPQGTRFDRLHPPGGLGRPPRRGGDAVRPLGLPRGAGGDPLRDRALRVGAASPRHVPRWPARRGGSRLRPWRQRRRLLPRLGMGFRRLPGGARLLPEALPPRSLHAVLRPPHPRRARRGSRTFGERDRRPRPGPLPQGAAGKLAGALSPRCRGGRAGTRRPRHAGRPPVPLAQRGLPDVRRVPRPLPLEG